MVLVPPALLVLCVPVPQGITARFSGRVCAQERRHRACPAPRECTASAAVMLCRSLAQEAVFLLVVHLIHHAVPAPLAFCAACAALAHGHQGRPALRMLAAQ